MLKQLTSLESLMRLSILLGHYQLGPFKGSRPTRNKAQGKKEGSQNYPTSRKKWNSINRMPINSK